MLGKRHENENIEEKVPAKGCDTDSDEEQENDNVAPHYWTRKSFIAWKLHGPMAPADQHFNFFEPSKFK